MRCEICNSKDEVRKFKGAVRDFIECRICFERIFRMSQIIIGSSPDDETVERRWGEGEAV